VRNTIHRLVQCDKRLLGGEKHMGLYSYSEFQ